jgi:competence protein ComK
MFKKECINLKQIISSYVISPKTMALLSERHIDYCTKVVETNQTYYINTPILSLVEQACLEGYSTYEGRRAAVKHFTGYHQKIPIPIIPSQNIFAFPTISPLQFDCCWLFPNHIQSIHPSPKNKSHSIVKMKNNQTLYIKQSYNTLRKQMHRSAFTMVLQRDRDRIHH